MNELIVPPAAQSGRAAVELLRAWVVDGSLHCTLAPEVWDEPANWGIMLADVARHVANALAERESVDPQPILASIAELFNAELTSPTDEPSGYFA
jgi:hypothetical protein